MLELILELECEAFRERILNSLPKTARQMESQDRSRGRKAGCSAGQSSLTVHPASRAGLTVFHPKDMQKSAFAASFSPLASPKPLCYRPPRLEAHCADVVKLADTQDLGSCGETRGGSSPSARTKCANADDFWT